MHAPMCGPSLSALPNVNMLVLAQQHFQKANKNLIKSLRSVAWIAGFTERGTNDKVNALVLVLGRHVN